MHSYELYGDFNVKFVVFEHCQKETNNTVNHVDKNLKGFDIKCHTKKGHNPKR